MANLGPKIPVGHVPGRDFVAGGAPHEGLKLGLITRVDELNLKCDVKIVTGGGYHYELDISQGIAGPRSFWGGVPEVNSLVILAYRRRNKNLHDAMILAYVPVGNKTGLHFDPYAHEDPTAIAAEDAEIFKDLMGPQIRYKRLRLRPGDVGGMSSSGAELVLSRDLRMTNRAGDMIELRDSERTLVIQATHKVEVEAGVHHFTGPIRRGAFWLPSDIFAADGKTLLTEQNRYYGRDEMQATGPGLPNAGTKFANTQGQVLNAFNDFNEFPPVTYSNGRRTFYAASTQAVNFEDPLNGVGSEAFTEDRLEMYHTTDLTPDVIGEIDGFGINPRTVYIERVLGTTVGNDPYSGMGQRHYARLLKPKIFESLGQSGPGKFEMLETPRGPSEQDIESNTTTGAFLFRIAPPKGVSGDSPFAMAVSKQGKLFLQLLGSRVESYADGQGKNVAAEINALGGIKAYIGASAPDHVSLNLTLEGGIVADIGSNSDGQAIKVRYHSSVVAEYIGVPDVNDVAFSQSVTGNMETLCTADAVENIQGAKATTVNGGYTMLVDRMSVNAQSGYTGNYGESNILVSGKSQYNYALAVLENIVLGGKISTILAGGLMQNVVAGASVHNVLGGATSLNSAAGAYSVAVGAGGISMAAAAGAIAVSAAAGAVSVAAAAGAVAVTAGLAVNIAAAVAVSLVAPQILFGGPAAVLGVCRGTPMMPPGAPSLDWVTGAPLMGGVMVRST